MTLGEPDSDPVPRSLPRGPSLRSLVRVGKRRAKLPKERLGWGVALLLAHFAIGVTACGSSKNEIKGHRSTNESPGNSTAPTEPEPPSDKDATPSSGTSGDDPADMSPVGASPANASTAGATNQPSAASPELCFGQPGCPPLTPADDPSSGVDLPAPSRQCGTADGRTSPCPSGETIDACRCGDDPRLECQTVGWCEAGTWQQGKPQCSPPNDSDLACPASLQAALGTPCYALDQSCPYPEDVHCYCVSDLTGSPCSTPSYHWYCGDSVHGADCAEGVPDVGSACSPEGARCGDPCHGWIENPHARWCVGGTWLGPTDAAWMAERGCGDG